MLNIKLSILINRPADQVWTFMTEPANAKHWMSGVIEAQAISRSSVDAALKTRKVQRFWGFLTDMTYEITEYEPNKKIAYKTLSGTLSGLLSYKASITFELVEAGTKLIYRGQGSLGGFLKPAEPLFTYVMKRRFRKDFNTLKRLVEAQGEAVPGPKTPT